MNLTTARTLETTFRSQLADLVTNRMKDNKVTMRKLCKQANISRNQARRIMGKDVYGTLLLKTIFRVCAYLKVELV